MTRYYLDFFDMCFPGAADDNCTKNNEPFCDYMIKPKIDMPITDTMQNLVGYEDKIELYEKFMKGCAKPWNGWETYKEYDGNYESILLSQTETGQEPTLKEESPSASSSKTAAKSMNGVLTFFYGLFSGMVLLSLVKRFRAKRSKKKELNPSLGTRDNDTEML